jgi:hypothetical protein
VKYIKRILRFLRILLFAFMFSVCMVLGVVPIIPKRKDEVVDEIKIEETDLKDDAKEKVILFKAES